MNTINNFDKLRPIITFDYNEDVVYQIQIIQRRKENSELKNNAKTLKHWFLYSENDLGKLCPKIVEMCKANRARAYINVEAKSLRSLGHQMIGLTNEYLYKGDYHALQNVFIKAYGRKATAVVSKKRWVIDADDYLIEKITALKSFVEEQHSLQGSKTEEPIIIPTPNGYHLVCQGFNPQALAGTEFEDIEIKKHAPTILFAAW